MAHMSLARRVEILEQNVESLKELPVRMAAVESQIVQLREEMRALHHQTLARFDDLNRHLHVLHEDTIERIARLDEGRR